MATINLGAIKFNWKGAYNSSTSYAVDDVVSSGGNSYVCIQAHSNQAVGDATAYWNIMSSAGTNGTDGTDLTSTLSTRGDIVYKGASALERLPKGTAGYYLKQGANDPEWAPVAGDYVKVAEGSVSNDATWDFASTIFDNSIYMNYDIFIEAQHHDGSQSGNGEFRLIDSSGNNIGGSTTSSSAVEMNSYSTNVNGYNRDGADSAIFYQDGFRNSKGLYMMTIQGMGRAEEKCGSGFSTRANHDGTTRTRTSWYSFFCTQDSATGWGIRFQFTAGATGTYKIFGRK